MFSSLSEVLAEHEEFVSKQLFELRERLLAEHKRQVSLIWSHSEGTHSMLPMSGMNTATSGLPMSSMSSMASTGHDVAHEQRRSSKEVSLHPHLAHEQRGPSFGSLHPHSVSSHTPGPPGNKQNALGLAPNALGLAARSHQASSENGAHAPLDLHHPPLGVIGESDEGESVGPPPCSRSCESLGPPPCSSSLISCTSSDGGLEVGCFAGQALHVSRSSLPSIPDDSDAPDYQSDHKIVISQEKENGVHETRKGSQGSPKDSQTKHIHVKIPCGDSDHDGDHGDDPTRHGSLPRIKGVKSIESIKALNSIDSKVYNIKSLDSNQMAVSQMGSVPGVDKADTGQSDSASVMTDRHPRSEREARQKQAIGQKLRHLHVVHSGRHTPMNWNFGSRSASKQGFYPSGPNTARSSVAASAAHSAAHSLAASRVQSRAQSRRASVMSQASCALPVHLQMELQDEFAVDHYCTPVLRLSPDTSQIGLGLGAFGGAHFPQDDTVSCAVSYAPSMCSSVDEEDRASAVGGERVQRISSGSRMGVLSQSTRGSQEGVNDEQRRVNRNSNELEPGEPFYSSAFSGVTDGVDDAEAEADVRLLPIWFNQRKSSNKISKRVQSNGYNVRNYTTNTIFSLEPHLQQQHAERWLLRPGSFRHVAWSLIGLVTIVYDCITMPLEVFDLEETSYQKVIENFIRMYWMVNVVVSFRTGYLTANGTVEVGTREIAKRYARTWLPMDIFTIALDWVGVLQSDEKGQIGNAASALRVLRTLRLARLVRAPEIAQLVTDFLNSEQVILIAHIAQIMTVMVWVVHCIACFWYGISTLDKQNGGWAAAEGIDAIPTGRKYAQSFHWSLMAFFGNTLILPTNLGERSFTIIVLFLAFVVSASFVSSMTTSMTRLQLISSQQSAQFAALRKYLLDHSITRPLAQRVLRNARYAINESKRNAPESSIELLAICSVPLRIELHYEIHSRVILNHPFFYCYNAVNPAGMRQICHTAVSLLLLTSGDVIFTDCEVPTWPRMFFVVSGRFWYMQEGKKAKLEVTSGQWFCEGVLWCSWMHRGTMAAVDESQLLMVDAAKFQNIVSTFHTDHPKLYANEYTKCMNKSRTHHYLGITDLSDSDENMEDRIVKVFQEIDDEDEDAARSSMDDVEGNRSVGNSSKVKFFFFKAQRTKSKEHLETDRVSSASTMSHESGNSRKRRISTVRKSLEFLEKQRPETFNGTGSQAPGGARPGKSQAQAFSVTSSIQSFGNKYFGFNKFRAGPSPVPMVKMNNAPDVISILPSANAHKSAIKQAPFQGQIEEDEASVGMQSGSSVDSLENNNVNKLSSLESNTRFNKLSSLESNTRPDAHLPIKIPASDSQDSTSTYRMSG